MIYRASIAFMIMFARMFAIKVTFPHQPDTFICNQNAEIQCDTESSLTTSISWYLDNVTIADCISKHCPKYAQAPSHYVFKPGQSPFTLSLNPAKMEDSGKSVYCKDTTSAKSIGAHPKTITVEVKPTNSTTTLNYTGANAETVSLNMTACLYPVDNLNIKWTAKKDNSIPHLLLVHIHPRKASSCGSTDCMATSILSEIELPKGNNLYSVCIEIFRADKSLMKKCTDQEVPLEVEPPTSSWLCVVSYVIPIILVIRFVIYLSLRCYRKTRKSKIGQEQNDMLEEIIEHSRRDVNYRNTVLNHFQTEITDGLGREIFYFRRELLGNKNQPTGYKYWSDYVTFAISENKRKLAIEKCMYAWRGGKGNYPDAVEELVECLKLDNVKRVDIVLAVVYTMREEDKKESSQL